MTDNNLDRYRVCSICGIGYFYFDSPAMPKCFCGGLMREPNKKEMVDLIDNVSSVYTATVSC
jgi:hypothetical protein